MTILFDFTAVFVLINLLKLRRLKAICKLISSAQIDFNITQIYRSSNCQTRVKLSISNKDRKKPTLSGNCCSSSAIGCSDGGGLFGGIIQPDLKIGTKSTTSAGLSHVSRDFVHFSPSEKNSSASDGDIVSRNCFND